MKYERVIFGLIFVGLLFSGCGPIHPTQVPLGSHDMTPISSQQPINLINAQESKVIKMPDGTSAELTEWTDQAIHLIKQWFSQNDVRVSENSEKYLKISISDAKSTACTELTLNVETSTGIRRSYSEKGCAGGFTHNRSAGYAINYVVVDLMHDRSIIKYLSE
jgi:hypothetical protein